MFELLFLHYLSNVIETKGVGVDVAFRRHDVGMWRRQRTLALSRYSGFVGAAPLLAGMGGEIYGLVHVSLMMNCLQLHSSSFPPCFLLISPLPPPYNSPSRWAVTPLYIQHSYRRTILFHAHAFAMSMPATAKRVAVGASRFLCPSFVG
jgi:hypothetical protein